MRRRSCTAGLHTLRSSKLATLTIEQLPQTLERNKNCSYVTRADPAVKAKCDCEGNCDETSVVEGHSTVTELDSLFVDLQPLGGLFFFRKSFNLSDGHLYTLAWIPDTWSQTECPHAAMHRSLKLSKTLTDKLSVLCNAAKCNKQVITLQNATKLNYRRQI